MGFKRKHMFFDILKSVLELSYNLIFNRSQFALQKVTF